VRQVGADVGRKGVGGGAPSGRDQAGLAVAEGGVGDAGELGRVGQTPSEGVFGHLLAGGVAQVETGQLLGAHVVGGQATELIGEPALARLFQGDPDGADALCARCRQFCADRGEQWSRSAVLLLSALVARTQADPVRTAGYLRESLLLRRALGDVFGMAQTLETIAAVATDAGDSTRAAKLFGATGRVWRSLGVLRVGSHHYQRQSQAATARARVDLGDEAFEAAIQDGWKLSPEEAFHYALEPERVPAPEPAQPAQPSPLTPRERQVAQLIADGLSNKQIAVRLVIAQRTAESHVENILAKLGFTSRTQIAAWVARRQG